MGYRTESSWIEHGKLEMTDTETATEFSKVVAAFRRAAYAELGYAPLNSKEESSGMLAALREILLQHEQKAPRYNLYDDVAELIRQGEQETAR